MKRVMFVCHGNICRSTMAEFMLKDMVKDLDEEFVISSSGTSRDALGHDTHHGTKKVLDARKIAYSPRRAVQFVREDYDKYDYIICMDKANIRSLNRLLDDRVGKVKMLLEYAGQNRDVADPWYTGDYESTYRDVKLGLEAFLKEIM